MIKSLIFDHCSATPTCSLTGFCCPVRYPARRLLAARNSIRPLVFPVAVHQPRVPVHMPQLLVWKQVVAYKHLDKLGARKPNEKVLLRLRGVVFLHFALVKPPCLAIVFECLNLEEPRLIVHRTQTDLGHKFLGDAECMEKLLHVPHGPVVQLSLGAVRNCHFWVQDGSWADCGTWGVPLLLYFVLINALFRFHTILWCASVGWNQNFVAAFGYEPASLRMRCTVMRPEPS